jgi:hypothetical protein
MSNVMNEELLKFEIPNEYQNPFDIINKLTKSVQRNIFEGSNIFR